MGRKRQYQNSNRTGTVRVPVSPHNLKDQTAHFAQLLDQGYPIECKLHLPSGPYTVIYTLQGFYENSGEFIPAEAPVRGMEDEPLDEFDESTLGIEDLIDFDALDDNEFDDELDDEFDDDPATVSTGIPVNRDIQPLEEIAQPAAVELIEPPPADGRQSESIEQSPADALQNEAIELLAIGDDQSEPVELPTTSNEQGEPIDLPTADAPQSEAIELPAINAPQSKPIEPPDTGDRQSEPIELPAINAPQSEPIELCAHCASKPEPQTVQSAEPVQLVECAPETRSEQPSEQPIELCAGCANEPPTVSHTRVEEQPLRAPIVLSTNSQIVPIVSAQPAVPIVPPVPPAPPAPLPNSIMQFSQQLFNQWRRLASRGEDAIPWQTPVSVEAIYEQGFHYMSAFIFLNYLDTLSAHENPQQRLILIRSTANQSYIEFLSFSTSAAATPLKSIVATAPVVVAEVYPGTFAEPSTSIPPVSFDYLDRLRTFAEQNHDYATEVVEGLELSYEAKQLTTPSAPFWGLFKRRR